MTHVHIRTLDTGAISVQVDGVEMALKIAAGSLKVVMPDDASGDGWPRVSMTLLADTLDVDLAAAEVTYA